MVFVDVRATKLDTGTVIERLRDAGVGATPTDRGDVRMVTHADVDDDGIDVALEAWREIAPSGSGRSEA
ncbi:MAG: hypothetical protein WEA10_03145 [Actinomycetota bacterium]